MDLPAGFLARLAYSGMKELTVRVIEKNVLTAIAPVHHMINGTGILNAQFPRHRPTLPYAPCCVNSEDRLEWRLVGKGSVLEL